MKDKFGFNFWPSFTDLMLSLVLVVLLILFVVSKMIAAGSENLEKARDSQNQISQQIIKDIGESDVNVVKDNEPIPNNNRRITIINKLDRQTITFSDRILFDVNQFVLKPEGKAILNSVGPVIFKNLDNISEIQIQGHADIDGEDIENLILASNRAIAVYDHLQNRLPHPYKVNPSTHLMSITSFGKFKPIGREAGKEFNHEKLMTANNSSEKKARNRRIEIVLFYKNDSK